MNRKIIWLDETDSTNDYAKKLAKEGAKEGTVVVANRQTKGKGRMGRSFFSPKDTGLYMSLILRPKNADCLKITCQSAVAVCRGIDKLCKTNAKIKWVNDIYLSDKKVCGILAEGAIDPKTQEMEYVILGIGVNIEKGDFPPEIAHIATSIETETGQKISKNDLLEEILKELDRIFKAGEFLQEYKARSMVLGKTVKVIKGQESYLAKAEDISQTGGLIITKQGEGEVLSSGEVSIRFED